MSAGPPARAAQPNRGALGGRAVSPFRASLPALLLSLSFPIPRTPASAQHAPTPEHALSPHAEAIWRAILRAYASGGIRSEGDVTLAANRATGVGEQRNRPRVVLMARLGTQALTYRRPWLDSLTANGTVDAVCSAATTEDCPDSVMTTFLRLAQPVFTSDSAATVEVSDEALNPAACRRHAGAILGGVMQTRVDLRERGELWAVVGSTMEIGGTTVCGFTPEDEARAARLGREDSLLRETGSPVAGTYRVTLFFGSGDSAVLYTRTELHPMSSIRDRRRDDVARDGYKPILGYDLATCSAASVDSLPGSFSGSCLQSYYAVSVVPIANFADSTLWHGQVDPLVEVTFLDPRAAVRVEARSLFGASEAADNSDWYFMPEIWITHRDGRVRLDYTVMRGTEVAYKVRADRISLETLVSRAR